MQQEDPTSDRPDKGSGKEARSLLSNAKGGRSSDQRRWRHSLSSRADRSWPNDAPKKRKPLQRRSRTKGEMREKNATDAVPGEPLLIFRY